ncbi:hypothetical protein B0J13DRAFT_451767, partial [Dactylonectria estremocensis]
DDFRLKGPEGTHTCLVYKPMRETLLIFQHRVPNQRLPLPLFKFFTLFDNPKGIFINKQIPGKDPLLTRSRLSVVDIKDDNTMVIIENDRVLENFIAAQRRNVPSKHTSKETDRAIYISQDDLGPLRGSRLLPQLGDFDLAFPSLAGEQGHLSAVQSHRYRRPEVLLCVPWSYSADIWNLGLLVRLPYLPP